MLRSYGAFLFLCLFIPGLTARDNIDDFSLGGASFFALNYPWPVGADEINIPRCRGRDSKDCFPTGLSFFAAICGAGTAP